MRKEHILVIRFSALGDVAMAVPVVWALATQYPDIRITVLSRAFARPLFADLAPNVNFMEADLKHEYRGMRGLNALSTSTTCCALNTSACGSTWDPIVWSTSRSTANSAGS